MKYTELCQKLHKRSAAMLTPQAQQAAIQPPAPPMDPSMMGAGGGMPPGGAPMDPAMMGGAPMDPAMAGGMPPQGQMPPQDQMPPQAQDPAAMQQEFLNQTAGMLQDIVDTVMEEKISVLQSKITAFNEKLDTIKTLLDDILTDRTKEDKQKAEQRAVNDQLQRELKNTQEVQPVQVMPTETLLAEEQPAQVPMNMLDVMRGV